MADATDLSRFASTDPLRVAYHEAGHAVVGWSLGGKIIRVALERQLFGTGVSEGICTIYYLFPTKGELLVAEFIDGYGGWAALEHRFGEGAGEDGVGDDRRRLAEAFQEFTPKPPGVTLEMLDADSRAAATRRVVKHWAAVEAVARALLTRGSLAGDEVVGLIKRALATK